MPDEEEYEEYGEEENGDDSIEDDLDDMLDDLQDDSGVSEEYEEAPESNVEEQYEVAEELEAEIVPEPEEPQVEEPKKSEDELKFDESLEELPKVGFLYGRLVDLVLLLIAVLMIVFFLSFGLWQDVDKIHTLEMGMMLNIGLSGLVGVVLLYVLASNNISKGDTLARKDTNEAHKAAIEKYNAALKIDKRSKKAWTCKGLAMRMVSHDEGNLKEALKCHNMALKIDPKYGVAWVNKGNVLFNMGWSDEALKCYDKAIDLDPDYTVAWVNKGEMLVKMGMRAEAKKCLDKANSLVD